MELRSWAHCHTGRLRRSSKKLWRSKGALVAAVGVGGDQAQVIAPVRRLSYFGSEAERTRLRNVCLTQTGTDQISVGQIRYRQRSHTFRASSVPPRKSDGSVFATLDLFTL